MRLYALVTNFSPLKVFIYRRGFARFTNSRYSSNMQDIYNGFVHLTNVAIQKTAENYDERTGGKMELQALKLFLMSQYGVERIDALFWEVIVPFIQSHIYHLPFLTLSSSFFPIMRWADPTDHFTRIARGATSHDQRSPLLRTLWYDIVFLSYSYHSVFVETVALHEIS